MTGPLFRTTVGYKASNRFTHFQVIPFLALAESTLPAQGRDYEGDRERETAVEAPVFEGKKFSFGQ